MIQDYVHSVSKLHWYKCIVHWVWWARVKRKTFNFLLGSRHNLSPDLGVCTCTEGGIWGRGIICHIWREVVPNGRTCEDRTCEVKFIVSKT